MPAHIPFIVLTTLAETKQFVPTLQGGPMNFVVVVYTACKNIKNYFVIFLYFTYVLAQIAATLTNFVFGKFVVILVPLRQTEALS